LENLGSDCDNLQSKKRDPVPETISRTCSQVLHRLSFICLFSRRATRLSLVLAVTGSTMGGFGPPRDSPMASEAPFRVALLSIFGLTVAIVGYWRWQAATSGERISRKDEGILLGVSLRLAGLGLWVATLAYLIDPESVGWAQLPIPTGARWLGGALGGLFIGLISWTLANLGKNLTDTVVTRTGATLITSGPYRLVRHPFYVSVGLLILAVTLLTANWFIGLSGLAVVILLVVRTPKEEQKLIERFGDQYRAYIETTGKFWPKPKRTTFSPK
jgi:protein-S-isoprenylcysteine O-methyltransferase Ste14